MDRGNVTEPASDPMVMTSLPIGDHWSADARRPVMPPRAAVGPALRPLAPAIGFPSPGLPPPTYARPRGLRGAGLDARVRLQPPRGRRSTCSATTGSPSE